MKSKAKLLYSCQPTCDTYSVNKCHDLIHALKFGLKGPIHINRYAFMKQINISFYKQIQQEWIAKQTRSKDVYAQNSTSGKQLSSEEKTSLLQPSPLYELNGWQRFNIVVIKKPLKKLR